MKKYFTFLCMIMVFCSCNHPSTTTVHLENPLSLERPDEAFVLTFEQLQHPDNGSVPAILDEDGNYVPSQLDDLDEDGRWDELAFVYTLKPHQKADLTVAWIDKADYPHFTYRTSVRYGKMTSPGKIVALSADSHGKYDLPRGAGYPYQMDGIAWENDKMGFRHYFDGRNNRDVFGKRVKDMVLDTVGIQANGHPGDTYHVLADWGRDIMSAANSFGLGGLAILSQDSLIRLGVLNEERTDIIDSTFYKLVVKGPVRSIFQVRFQGWEVRGRKIDVRETTTIWAGKYGYENVVETSELPAHSTLVTGIVRNFNDNELVEKKKSDRYTLMMTHDKQTYNKEWYMGMALLLPEANVIETFDTPNTGDGIIATWCVKLKPDPTGKIRFNAYAAWELQDPRFTQSGFFFDLIEKEADRLVAPVTITVH
ncbi:MAG: DUF4861 domain-containing protein [Tannerella sp.]|nr:DUF4861 domain-containing protein [Tannerella sp.]